jgi:hypothetical protein
MLLEQETAKNFLESKNSISLLFCRLQNNQIVAEAIDGSTKPNCIVYFVQVIVL